MQTVDGWRSTVVGRRLSVDGRRSTIKQQTSLALCAISPNLGENDFSSPKFLLPYERGGKGGVVEIAYTAPCTPSPKLGEGAEGG